MQGNKKGLFSLAFSEFTESGRYITYKKYIELFIKNFIEFLVGSIILYRTTPRGEAVREAFKVFVTLADSYCLKVLALLIV